MRKEVRVYLASRPDLKQFIRDYPMWYRRLSRNPNDINELEQQAKVYFGKTFPQKVERLQNNLNMTMMLIEMFRTMGSQEQQG